MKKTKIYTETCKVCGKVIQTLHERQAKMLMKQHSIKHEGVEK